MAALTAIQIMSLEAPELNGASFTKNGSAFLVPQLFQQLLDGNNNSVELALAQLFEMLTSEDRNESLRLGEFEFTRRTGMSFDERRYYWERKYRGTLMGNRGIVPTIGYSYWVNGPAVR